MSGNDQTEADHDDPTQDEDAPDTTAPSTVVSAEPEKHSEEQAKEDHEVTLQTPQERSRFWR